MPRVRAEGDTDRFARARAECDPEVIDVRRHAIDFGGEGNGRARDVNQIAVAKLRIAVPASLLVSMRQPLREIWRRPALRPFDIVSGHDRRRALPSHKTYRAKQRDGQGGEMVSGKRTQNSWRRAHKLVRETKQTITDQIKMEVLAEQKSSLPEK